MNSAAGAFYPHATGEAPSAIPAVEAAAYFRCSLDDQPDHLVPRHQMAVSEQPSSSLILNPYCLQTRDGRLPPEVRDRTQLAKAFELDNGMLWIRDVGTAALQPFWIDSEIREALDVTPLPQLVPAQIPERILRCLRMSGVFVANDGSGRAQQWKTSVQRCSDEFQKNGYAPIAGLIHPFHVSALRRYYRRLIRTGQIELGDFQSSLRYVAHNEPVACFFHHELTAAISAIAGQQLKPSYVYFSSYTGGSELKKHVDREQCEVSLTFCLDYSPEPERQTPWPIHLYTPGGKTTVFQALGDGLIYRGRELPHSRDRLTRGHSSTSIFFHYVSADFDGPLD